MNQRNPATFSRTSEHQPARRQVIQPAATRQLSNSQANQIHNIQPAKEQEGAWLPANTATKNG